MGPELSPDAGPPQSSENLFGGRSRLDSCGFPSIPTDISWFSTRSIFSCARKRLCQFIEEVAALSISVRGMANWQSS